MQDLRQRILGAAPKVTKVAVISSLVVAVFTAVATAAAAHYLQ